ncbi:Uncharacterized protein AC507_3086 [Pseudomonas syringae pv. maculicola]|nr:Uncharacterized protein AC507_3086 [Pseudomonas syringae pv. maculicola]
MTGVKNRAFCVRLLVEMKLLSVVLHQLMALAWEIIKPGKKRANSSDYWLIETSLRCLEQ